MITRTTGISALTSIFSVFTSRPMRSRRKLLRLTGFEILEQRTVPTTVSWDGWRGRFDMDQRIQLE